LKKSPFPTLSAAFPRFSHRKNSNRHAREICRLG
jgi:hypothetical protein